MQKPEGLGRLLLQSVPGLAADTTKLQMFVDKGRVAARPGATLGFEYRYTLAIVVQEFAGDVDALFVPVLAWIAEQQPDLLDRGEQEPFAFTAEILDSGSCDIQIDIELSELVRVETTPGGGWRTTRFEPRQIALDEFPGVCGAHLWQLFLRNELVAQTSDPVALAQL